MTKQCMYGCLDHRCQIPAQIDKGNITDLKIVSSSIDVPF